VWKEKGGDIGAQEQFWGLRGSGGGKSPVKGRSRGLLSFSGLAQPKRRGEREISAGGPEQPYFSAGDGADKETGSLGEGKGSTFMGVGVADNLGQRKEIAGAETGGVTL